MVPTISGPLSRAIKSCPVPGNPPDANLFTPETLLIPVILILPLIPDDTVDLMLDHAEFTLVFILDQIFDILVLNVLKEDRT